MGALRPWQEVSHVFCVLAHVGGGNPELRSFGRSVEACLWCIVFLLAGRPLACLQSLFIASAVERILKVDTSHRSDWRLCPVFQTFAGYAHFLPNTQFAVSARLRTGLNPRRIVQRQCAQPKTVPGQTVIRALKNGQSPHELRRCRATLFGRRPPPLVASPVQALAR